MDESLEFPADDGSDIVKPLSAYHHFSKLNSSRIKEELQKDGKDHALGVVVSVVSSKWKALKEDEKAYYENLAAEDRARYNKECALRDAEVLREQEERRKANALVATETRMRGSTMARSDALNEKSDVPKKKRELSEKEKQKKEQHHKVKKAEENLMKSEMNELKKEKAEQAEARLKYLLSQSDIFSHFGAVKDEGVSSKGTSNNSTAGKKSRRAEASDDLDEDERAMADEEEDDENEGTRKKGKKANYHVLTSQPKCIVGGSMRNYQLEGLNWMARLQQNGINGILADEMGLGKTLQSISILGYCHEFLNTSGPHLIMVPKSTLSNWCNEFKRWCPVLKVLRFHGSKEERQEIIAENLHPSNLKKDSEGNSVWPWDVVVTTYEIVNLEKTALTKIAWKYLIIDEAHRLKNEASQFSRTVRLLQTQHRLLLTGTPLQNNLHELWALLNFLLPDVFESSEQFDDWFNLDVDDTAAKERIIGQLHKLLRPFMLRRLKADVEKSLPPKTETILFTGMSAMQKTLYRQILLRDIDTINGAGGGGNGSRTAILNIVMQLRKCCNHPYLFPGMEDRTLDPMAEHLYQNCGKMVLLDKLLRKMKERGHRVLIFSQMTRMIDILEDYLISQNYSYCRIDGNTTYEDREDSIYEYNKPNSEKFVFVLSTRAGGLGINLQTADTVILYDSDWNPQADLQAQDRAHRIGQKKPVHVFRLVTDDTVEVKVVERAQQKLKLDAMVVQQGRLQDKEKKMSKQELLDTLRFGADKIFRSKESSISDADIDLILLEGKKRTEEIAEKLQSAEKGDLYDFRLDGGMGVQMFEGKDYSDKTLREKELNPFANLAFIEPGKRERKAIASYSETITKINENETEKKQKLPRHLRLGRMEDWQFYDKTRLNELQAEELVLFEQMLERGESVPPNMGTKFILLTPEQQEEKTKLLSEAFGDWTRLHFNNFIRASAKHGRNEFEKIAKDVGRPLDETKRYSEVFWSRGGTELPPAEWERVTKQIEKGEKRLEEISRLTHATSKLIGMFEDPWEELSFRNVGNQGRIFNAVEDRFLLCLTHLHGYGNWDQVRNSVRRCERFRFDFFLQSCSTETLGKRCEALMRSAERELIELERKKQLNENQSNSLGSIGSSMMQKGKNTAEQLKDRMADITKQIAEESKRLAATRAQLQKMKTNSSNSGNNNTSAGIMKNFLESGNPQKEKKEKSSSSNPINEQHLPDLARYINEVGHVGTSKVADLFCSKYPEIGKRQVELKITELTTKKKKTGGKTICFLLPEFKKYLNLGEGGTSTVSSGSKAKSSAKVSTPKRKREDEALNNSNSTGRDMTELAKNKEIVDAAVVAGGKEPKRFKRAFGFFVKANRAKAEKELGESASKTDALRDKLTESWQALNADERKTYETKEIEDKKRYEKELAAWNEALEKAARNKGSGSNKKKKV